MVEDVNDSRPFEYLEDRPTVTEKSLTDLNDINNVR